jgi:hypothetical protein
MSDFLDRKEKAKKIPFVTHIQTGIRAIDAPPNHLAVPDKNTAHRRLIAVEGELGHLDGLAHETLMVFAVGDRPEDHFVGFEVAREVGVW